MRSRMPGHRASRPSTTSATVTAGNASRRTEPGNSRCRTPGSVTVTSPAVACAAMSALQHQGLDRQDGRQVLGDARPARSEEHTSELQSLMRISYAVFCLKKKTK